MLKHKINLTVVHTVINKFIHYYEKKKPLKNKQKLITKVRWETAFCVIVNIFLLGIVFCVIVRIF